MRYIGLCVLVMLGGIAATLKQVDPTPSIIFAGVQDEQLNIFTYDPDTDTLGKEPVSTHPDTERFDNLSWSPDGLTLSFTQWIVPHAELEPRREELIIAPYLPDHRPYLIETSLARNLETLYTIQFDPKGFLIFVIRPPEDTIYEDVNLQGVVLDVYKRFYMPGAPTQRSGQIVHLYGCGHTPNSPMEAIQDSEGRRRTAVMDTPYGIVFTPFCFGSGAALSNEDSFTLLHNSLYLITLAPNSETFVGWDGVTGALVHYDLATQMTSECLIDDEITQFAWDPDGTTLYYSTRSPNGTLEFTPAETEALTAIMALPEYLTGRYEVNLYAMTPETCTAELLYSNPDAYAISRIQPHDEYVLFSEIAHGAAWFDHILADGERDFTREQSSPFDLVALKLYYMSLDGDARVIGQNIEHVTLRP